MASRRLALNLSQGLRGPAAGRLTVPFRRGLATPHHTPGLKTETTTLKNGLTVATQFSPYAQTSTVGVWIDAGSRAETDETSGTAHFLEHLSFKGTKTKSQQQIEQLVENAGAHLNAYTSRENTVYFAKSLNEDVPVVTELLADILQNSKLEESAIERERSVILRESEEVDKQIEEVVFDHLHATAFQNQPLGRTILGPRQNIEDITRTELSNYIKNNYTADRMVLVGAGGIPHQDLVELADKHFANLPSHAPETHAYLLSKKKPDFIGSDVRIRDDTIPTANIAIAVEGVSWGSEDYFTALVAQAIVGNYDKALGNAPHQGNKLSGIVHQNNLATSYMSFSTSYSDTGLWGIYLTTDNLSNVDDTVHFALREWSRLCQDVSEAETERAKSQLKASILLSLDGTSAVAEDIGRQILTTGRRMAPSEIERTIDAITAKDVQNFGQQYIWDKDIAVSAVGSIEGLFTYSRLRADMSRNL
ncbi:Metalloenzyme, LuxS/M16 peptidase-like protein [Podospora didyma]|uniref:mitochondrial processing peptidase n=1 Tax=Podospora didyma TaxID=330526 RepID=A0AAE0P5A4_9PEZI|nr:Metalloenzyme, LuxS/M16 peptidase-like protein [Podospora didyma]